MRIRQREALVLWGGENIADYLYGWSARVFHPQGKYIERADLQELRARVAENGGDRKHGVELTPVYGPEEVRPGRTYMRLTRSGSALVKTLIVVTNIERGADGVKYAITRALWPDYIKWAEGFCPLSALYEFRSTPTELYFEFTGAVYQKPEERKSFFERVEERFSLLRMAQNH